MNQLITRNRIKHYRGFLDDLIDPMIECKFDPASCRMYEIIRSPFIEVTVANTIYTAIKDSSDMTAKSKELVNKHYNIENTINKFSEIILDNE